MTGKSKKYKCLALMSGGLDSMLSAKIISNQGVAVTPLCFQSYFFGCDAAIKASSQIGLKLRIVDFSKEHLKMLKNPRYGRGRAMNPCIDCHLLMLKTARKIMKREGYDFIVTGEVLGQRPMSQNSNSMHLIEKNAGLSGLIVRPLSAKVLEETIPEKEGMIKRDELYGFSGRSRAGQLELVRKMGIKEYVAPAGGCILTDKGYALNLFKLFSLKEKADGNDCQIMRKGRIFFNDSFIVVVARDAMESQELPKMKKRGDIFLEPYNFSGPTVLVRQYKKSSREGMIDAGMKYLVKYSKNVPDDFIVRL